MSHWTIQVFDCLWKYCKLEFHVIWLLVMLTVEFLVR